MRSLSIGATGMLAQQLNVEVISHNIANMNTTAYTRRRVEFKIYCTKINDRWVLPPQMQALSYPPVYKLALALKQLRFIVSPSKVTLL